MGAVRAKDLYGVIDEFAVRFLERITPKVGEEKAVTLEQELQIFKELVKWAAIKNKISPDDEGGGKLNDYRRKLDSGSNGRGGNAGRGDSVFDGGEAGQDDSSDHRGTAANGGGTNDAIGAGIKALIAKKPPHVDRGSGEDERGVEDDSDVAGAEVPADAGDDRGVYTGLDRSPDA